MVDANETVGNKIAGDGSSTNHSSKISIFGSMKLPLIINPSIFILNQGISTEIRERIRRQSAAKFEPFLESIKELNKAQTDALKNISPKIIPTVMSQLAEAITLSTRSFLPPIGIIDFKKTLDKFRASQPENFRSLTFDEQLKLFRCSVKYRFGTVEVLPVAVIQAILKLDETTDAEVEAWFDASSDLPELTISPLQIQEILEEFQDSITKYCLTRLEDTGLNETEEFRGYANLLIAAEKALSSGHVEASQALSTVVYDSCLSQIIGDHYISKIKNREGYSKEFSGQETIQNFYRKAFEIPVVMVYPGDKYGMEYSRNTTIHEATPEQFTRSNSIKAFTIATSIVIYLYRNSI